MDSYPTIAATIASSTTDPHNVIELIASDPARPHDPPVWEKELPAPADQIDWGQPEADRVLAEHGYQRHGDWWNSTRTTGFPSWTASVVEPPVENSPRSVDVPDSAVQTGA